MKDQPEDDRPDRSKSANTHKVEDVPEPASFKDRTFELHEKINEIGRELFECHNECESFESIFTNLAKFYADNLPTIELNEKLKKKSF